MLTLLTREQGLLTVSAPSARRPKSKLGALEPMHTLVVGVETTPLREIGKLRESRLERARMRLLSDEARLDGAAELLRVARSLFAPHVPEPRLFDVVEDGLDRLERGDSPAGVVALALAWLAEGLGFGLVLDRCARCGTSCPEKSSALVDPRAGGLTCRSCGGGPLLVRADQRSRMVAALHGDPQELEPGDEELLGRIVRAALSAQGFTGRDA